jgi:two-component system chemotaxis response regulator CheY
MALNVLIVDDSPLMRKMVGRVLNLSGLEIGDLMDAGNGAEALQAMSEHIVDLVFVDINMPIMSGEDLVREMARTEDLRKVPVIVISTDGTLHRIEQMRDLGVVGYLQKPFRPEELRDEVDRVLQMRGLLEQQIYAAVAKATTRVLETMFFCCTSNPADAELNTRNTPLGVSVGFTGSLTGSFQLWASPQLASCLATNFLGGKDNDNPVGTDKTMLDEVANMICGATLTELFREGEFQLESPVPVSGARQLGMRGQRIDSDGGSMWVFFEVGRSKWRAEAKSEC